MDRATNVAARYPTQTRTAKPIGDKFKIIWCDPVNKTKTVVDSFGRDGGGGSSCAKERIPATAKCAPPISSQSTLPHTDTSDRAATVDAPNVTQDRESFGAVTESGVVDVDGSDSAAPCRLRARSASHALIPPTIEHRICDAVVAEANCCNDGGNGGGAYELRWVPTSDALKATNLTLCGKVVNPFVICGTSGQEVRPQRCPQWSSDGTTNCHLTRNGSKSRWINAPGYSIELPIPHFRCETHKHEFNLLNKAMAPFFDWHRGDCRHLLFSHSLLYSACKVIDVGLANAIVHDLFSSRFNISQIAMAATKLTRCTAASQHQQAVLPRTAIIGRTFVSQLLFFYAHTTQQQRCQRLEQLRRTTGTVLRFDHTYKFAASVGVRDNGKWVCRA
jgi:hypothetical protein